MPSSLPKPALYSRTGGVLSLPGPALQLLVGAVLDRGMACRFKVLGSSMHPFIRDGDVVTISPQPGNAWRLGDVVAFCHPEMGRLVVHRIMARRFGGYLLKGDNAPIADGLIQAAKILGLVVRVERNGRDVLMGRGPERRLLAWLARVNLLRPLSFRTWQVLNIFARRSAP